ncbi:hypothetical protein ATO00_11295 [Loigolactobacillus coryniformis subsp. coryniformis]|uniref:Uncharacterized protein n=1 Tax=Loigolactobacillus coryniformis subsp. coryniformis KCTC 3167 = DSM 20001 TaxID=913848 RepID=A0A0R1EYR6_9LACO|nr:hypothetical protein [Loigolactobacillus coryniformis]ATO55914.1 hypothetical protein LC20001_09860 [Loigolactobacillus coryniformis subsp. coryniformis KCTC 3167 = DSM 20001]KRK14725.1 hypothetical protein FD22_GL002148 [Loigolactobacillus coryniformis subsp. coryniformis KCTC 3167 = DSM 20001]OEH89406.1 hypothetical protein ATO00_11295 [Loigolactobacillus coryniformis subsp. coryniformis]
MSLATIYAGQKGWLASILGNDKYLDGKVTDSGWITTGFTLLNGCTTVSGDKQAYRSLTFSTVKLVFVCFSVNMPAKNFGSTTNVIQLPTGISNNSVTLSGLTVAGTDNLASWAISNGAIAVTARKAWTTTQAAIIRGAFTADV